MDHRVVVLHLSFNQDFSCVAIGTADGIRIFSIDAHSTCYRNNLGAVSIAEMLFCTSLVAFVGAGEQPTLSQRRVRILNTSSGETIKDLTYPMPVLAVRLNRQRLVTVTERATHVYDLTTLQHLRTLETPMNAQGVCALSSCSEPNLLALPASNTTGSVRVYDLQHGSSVVGEVDAHASPLVVLAWSGDAALLASAGTKGTLIRVHRLPLATKAYTFRRGNLPATVHSLCFSPPGVVPALLVAASSHATIHVFSLDEGCGASTFTNGPPSSAVAVMSAFVRLPGVPSSPSPSRPVLSVHLPGSNHGLVTCGLVQRAEGQAGSAASRESENQLKLVVAAQSGVLYEYMLEGLGGQSTPMANLTGEWAISTTSSLDVAL